MKPFQFLIGFMQFYSTNSLERADAHQVSIPYRVHAMLFRDAHELGLIGDWDAVSIPYRVHAIKRPFRRLHPSITKGVFQFLIGFMQSFRISSPEGSMSLKLVSIPYRVHAMVTTRQNLRSFRNFSSSVSIPYRVHAIRLRYIWWGTYQCVSIPYRVHAMAGRKTWNRKSLMKCFNSL